MSEKNNDNRLVEFERLNLVGKAIFITGTTFRFVGDLLTTVADSVSDLITDVEKSFSEGADSNIDDAKILDESDDDS
ncbi:MAG: hypothetical protein E2O84_04085 [Bacteroidetes bacterium]|nr:MAG: hypothetical protein E2O84_04085 [Bacteroidota bacterium]